MPQAGHQRLYTPARLAFAGLFPRGRTGHNTGRPEAGNWDAYLSFMDGQLRELLTNYGEIGGVWFDGMWDKPDTDWHLARTYALLHQLQPQVLVGSNHHKNPFPGEDFQMFEKDLPGGHTTGFNPEQSVSALPLETAETMNDSWDSGSRMTITRAQATSSAIWCGPQDECEFSPECGADAERRNPAGVCAAPDGSGKVDEALRGIDLWNAGGPVAAGPWGVTTQRGSTVYVHVLDWNGTLLALPNLPRPVRSARLLRDGSSVEFSAVKGGLVLKVPELRPDEVDRVVALELEAEK